jgi:hypothetical protein
MAKAKKTSRSKKGKLAKRKKLPSVKALRQNIIVTRMV